MKKKVNIYSPNTLNVFTPPQSGTFLNIFMTTGDILFCIRQGARVDELLPDGRVVQLDHLNFDRIDPELPEDQQPDKPSVSYDTIEEKPVITSISKEEETKEEVKKEEVVHDTEEVVHEEPVATENVVTEEAVVEEPTVEEEVLEEAAEEEVEDPSNPQPYRKEKRRK